ncbi:MAG TPA: CxxxxCH/CxxCH domain-containing protein [Anaeromyxobacteraceae bacterium]|nr:CxxxxCH/CxxCH domain-containing protein [Anaeromyxobacteraceae bacterium]
MPARHLFLAVLAAAAAGLVACGDARPVQTTTGGGGACTSCHGTSGRTGALPGTDPNLAAAPPVAPAGEPAQVVGAHLAHLNPAATGSLTGPIACNECHVVPADASHATNPPAQVVQFGALATTGGAAPTWNSPDKVTNTTCSNVYCHGKFSFGSVSGTAANAPNWTLGNQAACGSCHGLPPTGHMPLGGTVTPATCNGCHPGTVDASGAIIVSAATGASLHINGQADVSIGSCTSCHGTAGRTGTLGGTDPNLAAAPPVAPAGEPAQVVGAHQAHLNPPAGSLAGPIACNECHVVPVDSAHATNPPAQVVRFGTLATTGGAAPTWNSPDKVTNTTCSNVYCHGNFTFGSVTGTVANTPNWTGTNQAACGSCHGLPPTGHLPTSVSCSGCHPGTVDASFSIIVNPATGASLHVNGQADEGAHADPNWVTASGGNHTLAALNQSPPFATCLTCHTSFGAADPNNVAGSSCNACHGAVLAGAATTNWQQNCVFCHGDKSQLLSYAAADQTGRPYIIAPPTGAGGETSTSDLAVGAHQKHVSPTGNTLSNAFLCSECHTPSLPPDISQATHLTADGSVPVLLAGGLATSGGVQGSWTAPSCSATYCHGNYSYYGGQAVGNNATPAWTTVDGTWAGCGTCHGAPPNTGHHYFHMFSAGRNCSTCHNGIATGSGTSAPITNGAVVGKASHVNGVVDVILVTGRTWDGTGWFSGCGTGVCH